MLKKIIILFFLLLFFIPQSVVLANGAGLPAFFKINGKYALSNPLQTYGITASSFLIPQDLAPETYLVNQPIYFEINENQLQTVISPELLKTTKFSWDFGDGTKAEGLTNEHVYNKMGSYILVLFITVYTKDSPTPTQFIDSFSLNILPDKNFRNLPNAVIKIDGKLTNKNPLYDVEHIDLNTVHTFDASASSVEGGKIVSYYWNFGDGETSTRPVVTHEFKDKYFQTVVLRVVDEHGFISDSFVGVKNDTSASKKASAENSQASNILFIFVLGLCVIALSIVVLLFLIKRKK